MSGAFDPYAYAASQGNDTQGTPFDPYAYAAHTASDPNYVPPSVGGGNSWSDVLESAPGAIAAGFNRGVLDIAGTPVDAATNLINLGKAGAGYLESKITGKAPPAWSAPINPADAVGGSEWLKRQAARPAGGSIVNYVGDPQSYIDQTLSATAEQVGPGAATAVPYPDPEDIMRGVAGLEDKPLAEASGMTTSPQSISAAAATPNLTTASPELRAAVSTAMQNGEPVNAQILERHIQAESLPVPTRLTVGQATQDPILISQEQNQRGAMGSFARHFNSQNQNLLDNMQAMRDRIGPDVHSTNQVEHGETLIKAYQDKAAAADADIAAKYKALTDANGGQFPVDAKTLKGNVDAALHQRLLYEHAPSAEMAQLQRAAEKGMTFEQYEAMRTNLARVMRSSSDGNERVAAGVIRRQMEDLPLTGQAAQLKPLADAARAAAKAQFEALDADPAYKAAVNGVAPDRFVHRFIVNGNRDDLALMRRNLAGDETAQQTIGTAALEHLRKSARIDEDFRGNFASQSYNNALQSLGPKLHALFTPQQIEDLRNIGDVARYESAQPKGSYVNNSATDVSRAAREAGNTLKEHAGNAAEYAVNAKTFGIGGTMARKFLRGAAERRMFRAHTAPGAGITWQTAGATP